MVLVSAYEYEVEDEEEEFDTLSSLEVQFSVCLH